MSKTTNLAFRMRELELRGMQIQRQLVVQCFWNFRRLIVEFPRNFLAILVNGRPGKLMFLFNRRALAQIETLLLIAQWQLHLLRWLRVSRRCRHLRRTCRDRAFPA